ncbi:PREDICTED: cytochrome b561-like [Cyprinodon variegatus]|uniref:cytochrome b561-like n=1 Tax=Cyprinodon variegatus TaxID=28743 RepID=UPI0007427D35|nr:PREDICTED: cytochrome b561-like [Cyprinodon variegatus]
MEDSSPRRGGSVFAGLVGASQVLGLVSVVLTGVWMGHYRGGFAWDGSGQEFNLHPLCMVLGLIFLHGDGGSTQSLHHCWSSDMSIISFLYYLFYFKCTVNVIYFCRLVICIFAFLLRSTYSQFAPEGILANILGILLVSYGVALVYLITKDEYRRPPNPEEEALSVHFKNLTEGGEPTSP